MESILNNPVIFQLRKLHNAAIILKEYHDKKAEKETILAHQLLYLNEFESLKKIIPENILKAGSLVRHSGWIKTYNSKKQPGLSYEDLKKICLEDIFLVEEKYFEHISKKTLDTITALFS